MTLNLPLDTTILYLLIQNRNDSKAVCSVILSFTELPIGLSCVSCAYNNVFMRSVLTTPVNLNFLKGTIVSSALVIVVTGNHCNSIHPSSSAYSIQGCDGTGAYPRCQGVKRGTP